MKIYENKKYLLTYIFAGFKIEYVENDFKRGFWIW